MGSDADGGWPRNDRTVVALTTAPVRPKSDTIGSDATDRA
jgi:hypothetical protein